MSDDDTKVKSLLPWEISVRRAEVRRRAIELVKEPDADQKIKALTEVEVYYAVKEAGLDEALPVLAVVEPSQIKAMLDLDCWAHHELQISDLLTWLLAFREAKAEQLVAAAKALDLETLALLFRRRLYVFMKQPEDDDTEPPPDWYVNPPDSILPLVDTADGRFVLAARTVDPIDDDEDGERIDEEERKWILELVDLLYKDEDWEHTAGALRLASDDLSTSLEEDALRFRNARIEDLGFPPLERAIQIYGPLDPDGLLQARPAPNYPTLDQVLPALYTPPLAQGLFHEALSRIDDPILVRRIEGDLVPVANQILVADGRNPGDLMGLRGSLTAMRGYLDLALAHGMDRSLRLGAAIERLGRFHVGELVRMGYTLTIRLGAQARAVRQRSELGRPNQPLGLLEEAERSVIEGLIAKRPRFSSALIETSAAIAAGTPPAQALEEHDYDPLQPDRYAPFSGPSDLEATQAALHDLAALADALAATGLSNAPIEGVVVPPQNELTTAVLIATATAQVVLERGFVPTPLTAEDLLDLLDRWAPDGFPPPTLERVLAAVSAKIKAPVPAALERRIETSLVALSDALRPLVGAGEIDPRFVGVVLRRLG